MEGFLRRQGAGLGVVALVLEAGDVVAVAEYLKNIRLDPEPVWLVGSLGLELRRLQSWKTVFRGGAFVEPHMPELREFRQFFLQTLQVSSGGQKSIVLVVGWMEVGNNLTTTKSVQAPDAGLAGLAEEYMAENTGCVPSFSNGKGVSCNNIPPREMELRFQQEPQVRAGRPTRRSRPS